MHCTFHALNNQLYWTIFWSPLSSIYASTVPGRQGLVLKQHITALPDHSLYSCWNYWSKQRKWQIKQAMLQYAQPALQYFHRARDRKEKALTVCTEKGQSTPIPQCGGEASNTTQPCFWPLMSCAGCLSALEGRRTDLGPTEPLGPQRLAVPLRSWRGNKQYNIECAYKIAWDESHNTRAFVHVQALVKFKNNLTILLGWQQEEEEEEKAQRVLPT